MQWQRKGERCSQCMEWSSHLSWYVFYRSGRGFAAQPKRIRKQRETLACRRYSKGNKVRQCSGIRLPVKEIKPRRFRDREREREEKAGPRCDTFNEKSREMTVGCTKWTKMVSYLAIILPDLCVIHPAIFCPSFPLYHPSFLVSQLGYRFIVKFW